MLTHSILLQETAGQTQPEFPFLCDVRFLWGDQPNVGSLSHVGWIFANPKGGLACLNYYSSFDIRWFCLLKP
jgi:hypothetical protein